MNIDIESIGLLSLILQDSPKDRQLILCVLARSNSVPTRINFNPNTEYPTFYGYSNSRILHYLMGEGVLSNVPREGYAKRLISSHNLSRMETIINRAKNWDIPQKLMSVSKFITLDNKTKYKDAEVLLVFRDKALGYIKDYSVSHNEGLSEFLGMDFNNAIKEKPEDNVVKKQIAEQALRPTSFSPRSVLPVDTSAEEVIKNFSPANYYFVRSVVEVIVSLTDFSPDGKIAYQLQYPPGQSLINERRLLDRLSQMGLLSHYGEHDIFGIVTLGNINVKVLREVEVKLLAARTNEGSTNKTNVQTEHDELDEIEKWIKNKDSWTRKKIWQVVSVLNSEWQLRDEYIFKIPIEKFAKNWVDNERELEAILANLHNRKIIEVSRKLGETPPTNNPNKPQGSIWATITDQPEIIRKEDTQIKLFTKKFDFLVSKLRDIAQEDGRRETGTSVAQQSSVGIEWYDDFQWQGNDFVFGSYGKASFTSEDRKKLFRLFTDAKGNWVTVQKMEKETGKNEGTYIRPTIGQIEKQLDPKLRKHVSIPSTQADNAGQKPNQGAYRIKFVSKPQQPQPASTKKSL